MRKLVAYALAGAALAVAVAFAILTSVCGMMRASPGSEGECVSALHPMALVWAAFAAAGGTGFAFAQRWPAIALGAVGFVLGILTGLSSGWFGIGSAGLLLAAGLTWPTGARAVARPSG